MDERPRRMLTSLADERRARLDAPRLRRESKTTAAMLAIYCRHHHGQAGTAAGSLCAGCSELLDYARKRLALCPYGSEKPTCVNCPIHCYGRHPRERMREVMRYAGPRMLWRHPWLALAHLVDGRRPAPPRPQSRAQDAGRLTSGDG